MIRFGYIHAFSADPKLTIPVGPSGGVGATVDFSNTLGGSSNADSVRLDSLFRFNRRHALGFSWYRIGLAGNRALQQSLPLPDGSVLNAGASTNNSLGLSLYRLLYNWSFYHEDKVELAISPGLYMANIKFDLFAQGNITGPGGGPVGTAFFSENLTLPLPSIGLLVNYDITENFLAQFRTDFFYLEVGDFRGSMFELYAGLEYRLFKYFGIGAAYDRLVVDVSNNSDNGFTVDIGYNLVYLYGTVYVFDTPL